MWLRGVMFAACARALQQTCVSPGACRNIRLSAARDAFFLSSFSDGVLGQPETGELIKAAVQERAAGERVRFAYVPTAGYALRKDSNRTPGVQRQRARRDGKQKRDRVVDFLGGPTACDALTLDLCDASIKHAVGSDLPTDGADVLGAWDPHLVLVDGGNTFWLRHYMEDWMDAFAAPRRAAPRVSRRRRGRDADRPRARVAAPPRAWAERVLARAGVDGRLRRRERGSNLRW